MDVSRPDEREEPGADWLGGAVPLMHAGAGVDPEDLVEVVGVRMHDSVRPQNRGSGMICLAGSGKGIELQPNHKKVNMP